MRIYRHVRASIGIGAAFVGTLAVGCGGGGGGGSAAAPPPAVPAAPTGLAATAGDKQVALRWNAVAGAVGYNLYLASAAGVTKATFAGLGDGARVAGVPRTYTQTGLVNGRAYFFVVTAFNTGGEGAESAEATATPNGGGGDVTAPTATITTPTAAATLNTALSPVSIGGTASDDVGVATVSWSNAATGATGVAAGTTFWAAFVTLASGNNAITVTATDAAGNSGTATLTVTYTPAAAQDGKQKWLFATGGHVDSSPALAADGSIAVGSADGKLYLLDALGEPTWTFSTGGTIGTAPAIGADGVLYAASADGRLYAINSDGTQKWAFAPAGGPMAAPAVGSDGSVFVSAGDGNLYAVAPDGTQRWTFPIAPVGGSSPVIGPDGVIYIGSLSARLVAINPDGTQKWAFTADGAISASPAIGPDGSVFVGAQDGGLYAVNPDGTTKWTFVAGAAIVCSPAVGADGTLYVGSIDRNLYAIDPNGTKKWSFTAGGPFTSSAALGADGTVAVGSTDGNLYVLNADGSKKWAFAPSRPLSINSSPAIGADGTIYVGSEDFRVYAVSSSNGGLAATSWPKFRRSAANTGSAQPAPSRLFMAAGAVSGADNAQSLLAGLAAPTGKFTDASLKGDYRYARMLYDGAAAAHRAETGTITFNGAGAAARTFTQNDNGVVSVPPVAGDTYAVAANGALTYAAAGSGFSGSLSAGADLFLASGATSAALNVQSILVAVKAPAGAFSNASLTGSYRYVRMLFDGTAAAHRTETGTITFDGAGAATRAFTQNSGGAVTVPAAPNDTYAVAANGSLTYTTAGNGFVGSVNSDATLFMAAGATSGAGNIQSLFIGWKAPAGVFSNTALVGDYRYGRLLFDGTGGVHKTEAGTITFDGIGNAVRTFAENANGVVANSVGVASTYNISTNGTLTVTTPGSAYRGSVK